FEPCFSHFANVAAVGFRDRILARDLRQRPNPKGWRGFEVLQEQGNDRLTQCNDLLKGRMVDDLTGIRKELRVGFPLCLELSEANLDGFLRGRSDRRLKWRLDHARSHATLSGCQYSTGHRGLSKEALLGEGASGGGSAARITDDEPGGPRRGRRHCRS